MATRDQDRPSTYPCLDCGTRYGYSHMNGGKPNRTHGLCANCVQYHRRAGTLDRFIVVRQAMRPTPPAAPQARFTPPPLCNAAEVKDAQRQAIAARVARNDGIGVPLVEGERNTAARIAAYEAFAAEWIAAHAERLVAA